MTIKFPLYAPTETAAAPERQTAPVSLSDRRSSDSTGNKPAIEITRAAR